MSVKDWESGAHHLFQTHIVGTGSDTGTVSNCIWKTFPNLWRVAWALDTVNDYFALFPNEVTQKVNGSPRSLYEDIYRRFLTATGGNWWDDYGWGGIMALRAAESGLYPAAAQEEFVKIAINSYCYMYGPGWRTDGAPTQNWFYVPYLWASGWFRLLFLRNRGRNIGAPNVYANAPDPVVHTPKANLKPKFPGGIWNVSMAGLKPSGYPKTVQNAPDPGTNFITNLLAIQNTVTNGLHALMALRLLKAFHNPAWKHLFTDRGVEPAKLFAYWSGQMQWFDQWFGETGAACMKYSLGASGALIRERAPQFGSNLWDAAYYSTLVWSGDQGIMLGIVNDLQQARANPQAWVGDLGPIPDLLNFPLASDLMTGVYDCLYETEDGTLLLRPWAMVTLDGNGKPKSDFPFDFEHDPGDYITGCGTFYRYLGQFAASGGQISSGYVQRISDAADAVLKMKSPDVSGCECVADRGGPSYDSPCDALTPWINRLATLCLAIQLNR